MARTDWKDRVTIDSEVHHGDPCIKGTRIPVSIGVGSIANGVTIDEIRGTYPQVSAEDVRAALAYAAEVLRTEVILPLASCHMPKRESS
jgi:uncharacterized protein (DUF433 family)